MSAHLYIEGAHSPADQRLCREAFAKLLQKMSYAEQKRRPRLTACGSRNAALDDFRTALTMAKPGDFVALLIDSEDPVADLEQPWQHLRTRDHWPQPAGTSSEQVLLMVTCMETWIVADREALERHYGHKLQVSALPPTVQLEARGRKEVQESLAHATRHCKNAYRKGARSFAVLAELNPYTLASLLPSFHRVKRILDQQLSP